MLRPPVTTTASISDFRTSEWRAICESAEDDYFVLSDRLRTAAVAAAGASEFPKSKVLWLLGDVCALHLEAANLNDPFRETIKEAGRPFGIEDLNDSDIDLLGEICPELDVNSLRARVADLLWLRRRPRKVHDALTAIEAYRCAPLDADAWFLRDSKSSWQRAIVLALQIRSPAAAVLGEIQTALLSAVDVQLDGGDAAPSMIELLLSLDLARAQIPDLAERLATRAHHFSSSDQGNRFFLSRHYFALAKRCFGIEGDHERSADMDCAISQAYSEEAAFRISGEHRSYVVAADFYAQAAQALLAIPKSMRALRDIDAKLRTLRQIQRDTAMQSIGDFVPMRGQHVDIKDETLSAGEAVAGRALTEALLVLTEIMPLASRREAEATTREKMTRLFLHRAFSTSKLANDGRVIAKSPAAGHSDSNAQDTEAAVWAKMMESHTFRIRFTAASAIVPALQQVHLEHCISENDLINIVALSGTVPAERVSLVAKGLKAGFEGDFVVALHLLVPQLEHLVRVHLQHYGEKTTTPDTDGLQREAGLSSLVNLPGMEAVFGTDLAFEIRALFCERFGPNLRNELAHGLLDAGALQSAESIYAWWLIFRLIYQQYWYRE